MTEQGLEISYFSDNDILVFQTAESSGEGETLAPDLWVIYGRAGEVSSVSLYGAAKLLRPYLFPTDGQECQRSGITRGELKIFYAPETDTLELQTGEPPYTPKTAGPGLYVNFDAEGWAMDVVIERAAERLRPYIGPAAAGMPEPATAGADAAAGAD